MIKRILSLATAFVALSCSSEEAGSKTSPQNEGLVERPPQYVLLAFDGSKSLSFWDDSIQFGTANDIRFTYFISGPYFLRSANKSLYDGPGHPAGASDIGFGEDAETIKTRFGKVKLAFESGHEIASHANGHFDGRNWSEAEWTDEFNQFDRLIFDSADMNGQTIKNSDGSKSWQFAEIPALPFDRFSVTGFRAPLLGQSSALYDAMGKRKNESGETIFRYDTSQVDRTNYWPERHKNGIWNMPLASFKIVGSGKSTLSMDYNFFVAQSKGVKESDPTVLARYKKEMLDTYRAYFRGNYLGNRAPINIGHHFSLWNGGIYWKAMQEFALEVCGLPEVKCVTYSEFADFLDANEAKIEFYRNAQFEPMEMQPGADDEEVAQLEEADPDAIVLSHEECDEE